MDLTFLYATPYSEEMLTLPWNGMCKCEEIKLESPVYGYLIGGDNRFVLQGKFCPSARIRNVLVTVTTWCYSVKSVSLRCHLVFLSLKPTATMEEARFKARLRKQPTDTGDPIDLDDRIINLFIKPSIIQCQRRDSHPKSSWRVCCTAVLIWPSWTHRCQ